MLSIPIRPLFSRTAVALPVLVQRPSSHFTLQPKIWQYGLWSPGQLNHATEMQWGAVEHPVEKQYNKLASQRTEKKRVRLASEFLLGEKCRERIVTAGRRGLFTELQSVTEETDAAAEQLEYETPLKIVLYPDPRLRKINNRINIFDEQLRKLVAEMFDIMYKTDGVGLSAPQVGVNVRMMLYNPEGERGKGQEYVLVNPKIVKYGKVKDVFKEGCLSFPEIHANVERSSTVRVEAQDANGKKFGITLKGWQARIFQHEYDHLEGILYFDRMTPEVLETIRPSLKILEESYESRTGLPSPERIMERS